MPEQFTFVFPHIVLAAAVGCGVMAGLFFAFSFCVMRALASLPAREGVAAMQAVNVVILNPVFFTVFFGTALASVLVLVGSWAGLAGSGRELTAAGAVLYILGCILVTIVANVPLNNRLAVAKADDPSTEPLWAEYLDRWTTWNHVRTYACTAAAVAQTLAYARIAG